MYTCGNYLKLLSFKTQTSIIIYKNLIELTAMCIVQQNPNIVAFGTISGAIKEFDMKSKQVVRRTAKQHKGRVTSLTSWGKYLISVSQDEDLIIVYDYQR